MARRLVVLLTLTAVLAGCGTAAPGPGTTSAAATPGPLATASSGPASGAAEQRFPDVDAVTVTRSGEQLMFAVTISSPYDTPQRYADAFRIRSADGTVFGVRELDHDHATEQPFTRTLDGVTVPAGTSDVVVEGRDLANGWGGETRTVALPG